MTRPGGCPEGDYGSRRGRLWWAGLNDRLHGRHARANARWGRLRPPPGRGAVIWLKAGATAESALVAAELAAAIRHSRLDVRLVLSVECDHAALIQPRFKGQRRMAYGYGPCDAPRAAARALERLDPLGVIVVDAPPREHLLRLASARVPHLIGFNTAPFDDVPAEAAYPRDTVQAQAWQDRGTARYLAPAADPLALLVESQVQPTLRSLVQAGRHDLTLWWAHGLDRAGMRELVEAWRDSPLAADGVLLLSGDDAARWAHASPHRPGPFSARGEGVTISQWDRSWGRAGLEPGTVVVVDDSRWIGAVAGACAAGYLASADRWVLWQALAAGLPLTLGHHGPARYARLQHEVATLAQATTLGEVLADWLDYRDNPARVRQAVDGGRRLFWQQRRAAEAIRDEFLQRVYDW